MAKDPHWVDAEDWHTGGEPFRIVEHVPQGYLNASMTVSEQREQILRIRNHPLDVLRKTLCHEPRGHADMYGGFIMPPNDKGANFGVLFWHKDGFSTACGHGTIALGQWALASGIVCPKAGSDQVEVVIDVPSGRVVARVFHDNGTAKFVDFVNVESYQVLEKQRITLQHEGKSVDINAPVAFAGALYASVEAGDLGLEVLAKNHHHFVRLQRQIRTALNHIRHENKYDLYGVIFYEHLGETDASIFQKNVVVFAGGQVDRSPCGSGTCARVAILLGEGKLNIGQTLVHSSIINTTFEASVEALVPSPTAFPACIPSVRGEARLVSRHQFYIDESDPVYPGFLLDSGQ